MLARRESPPIIITPKPEKPKEEAKSAEEETPEQRKFPKVAIAVIILIIAAIALGPTLYDKYKGVKAEYEAERMSVFADYFDRQKLGENYSVILGDVEINGGEIILKGGYKREGRGQYSRVQLRPKFQADNILIEFDAYVSDSQRSIECYIEDGSTINKSYPLCLFDGQAIIALRNNNWFKYFKSGGIWQNQVHHFIITRNTKDDWRGGKKVYLTFIVKPENGRTRKKEISYNAPPKRQIEIGFNSFGKEGETRIDNLKIYASYA